MTPDRLTATLARLVLGIDGRAVPLPDAARSLGLSVDQAQTILRAAFTELLEAGVKCPAPTRAAKVKPRTRVYLKDVRPLSPFELATAERGIPAVAGARLGWATDSRLLIPVPHADRPALVKRLELANLPDDGRFPDVAKILAPGKGVSSEPFALTGRAWAGDQPIGILTSKDGRKVYVGLRHLLTLVKFCPGCRLVQAADGGPVFAVAKGKPLGCVMPAAGPFTEWSISQVQLSLSAGGVSARLSRGQWVAVYGALGGDTRGEQAEPIRHHPTRNRAFAVVELAGRAALAELLGIPDRDAPRDKPTRDNG